MCRAREIQTPGVKLQATALWMSKYDPQNYKDFYTRDHTPNSGNSFLVGFYDVLKGLFTNFQYFLGLM